MIRSRIHDDQVVDAGFISEAEFNDFHGQVVITGTTGRDDTELTTSFDNYLPGRGIFVGSDGNTVTTGTNTINITGFYNEFVASSGTLQGEIDGISGDASGSITVSGVTVTGAVFFDSLAGITIIPDGGTNTLTFSGTVSEGEGGSVSPESILYIYENTGGQSIASATAITFDTDATVDTGYSFTASTSDITFDVAGDYEVTYTLTAHATSGGTGGSQRSNVDQWMEEDTGGGFTEIPGTRSMSYVRGSVFGAEGSQTIVRTFAAGDILRLVADLTAGAAPAAVKPDGASITIRPARAQGAPGPEGPAGDPGADGGVVDITASGTTLSGSIIIEGEGGNSLYVSGQTIVISGSGGSGGIAPGDAVTSINTLTDDVTIAAGNNIVVDTAGQTITLSSFTDDDVDSITVSGVTMSGSVTLATVGGTTITPDNSDSDNPVITISGGASVGELVGSLFQIEFTNGGSSANTWLAVSDSSLGGNTTPWTACFPCRLAGLAFSNRNDDVDQDVEIHVAREGDGNTSTTEYVWEVRDARTAYKTNMALNELVLDPGDKVAVYLADQGGNARDVFVGLYVEITSRTTAEGVENWSGNIS